ncbi:MAG: hypothetical protein CMM01_00605 [Rhodopirellula sp.]|nr:hypothetical protein [Rhodopirellula sp.]
MIRLLLKVYQRSTNQSQSGSTAACHTPIRQDDQPHTNPNANRPRNPIVKRSLRQRISVRSVMARAPTWFHDDEIGALADNTYPLRQTSRGYLQPPARHKQRGNNTVLI